MKRAHVVDDAGLIVNTVMVVALGDDMIDADLVGGSIGDQIINGEISPRAPAAVYAPVPAMVTMRQARRALFDAGLLAEVEAAIAAIADSAQRTLAQIDWNTARDVERRHPFTLFMAEALGLDDAELDDLFRKAATL